MPLSKKQRSNNENWIEIFNSIEKSVSKKEIDALAKKTASEIKSKIKGKKVAYAWSGGKDSIVLSKICELAGVTDSMIGVCNLEYPEFFKWIEANKPKNCTIINTNQGFEWLYQHQDMLFPQSSQIAARWFSIVQHAAQRRYYKDNNLDLIILGRRLADGNYVGGPDAIYTDRNNVTRYSPLAKWTHEQILAYIHYNKLALPPIYEWKNGYICGTHPWPARQWTGSIQNGWQEIYDIDKSIVKKAAEHNIESAVLFLKGGAK